MRVFLTVNFILSLFLIAGCTTAGEPQSQTAPVAEYNVPSAEAVKTTYFFSLENLNKNPMLTKSGDNSYVASNGEHKISVSRNPFESATAAKSFLLNRRTYLHQAYSTLIAPYFGTVQADADCMKHVNVTGELKQQAGVDFIMMSFVANPKEQLVDCYSEKPSHTVKYYLYSCKKTNAVFEVKLLNRIGAKEPVVYTSCN
jgi:hypothetical protein